MIELDRVPEGKRALLLRAAAELARVPGVAAVALGGSYAAGAQHAGSDLDVGVYYLEAAPPPIAEIRRLADALSVRGPATVTGLHEWGPWVNGGAWIHTAEGKLDLLYRAVEHVQRTIAEAQEGISRHDYDQQPASGFHGVMYLAETRICVPLHDPRGILADLKRRVEPYPPRLRERLVADHLWSAEFTLLHARGFAGQGDVYNTVGCLVRAAAAMTQALFALNERYYLRDKRALEELSTLPQVPPGHAAEIARILAHPGMGPAELTRSVDGLQRAWRAVTSLPGVGYRPRFQP